MRIRLAGWPGSRPFVPDITPIDPIDPDPVPPLPVLTPDPLILAFADGDVFSKATYQVLGYNSIDILCIGGAGGRAGGFKRTYPTTENGYDVHSIRSIYGGGGGGGGLHRIKGKLALLPSSCAIVVGAAGTDGAFVEETITGPYIGTPEDEFPDPDIEPGTDGGYSSFGSVICRASGGMGGTEFKGGDGGVGNSIIAGDGGVGGSGPGPGASPYVATADGTWNGVIGKGGGGGFADSNAAWDAHGGAFRYTALGLGNGAWHIATPGGRGSYNSPDTLGPGGVVETRPFDIDYTLYDGGYTFHSRHYDVPIYPGNGGGAKPYVITGEDVQYGSKASGNDFGLVVCRLTHTTLG